VSKSQASNQFTMVKSFAFLVVTVEAAICTATKDLVVSEPQCYHGVVEDHNFREVVFVKIADFGANGGGHMEVTGSGGIIWESTAAFTCSNKVFTKSGLKITTDLSDCLTGVTIPEIDFCSDQDAVMVTVKADVGPLLVTATLSRVACSQDCLFAQFEDECNNKAHCCWVSHGPWSCFPCSATATTTTKTTNDAVTGVAEQEFGLASSQVLTSRPLKQYAVLGNSGVVEEEPDMGLVDFHTEEPVQQHAALRDECWLHRSEDDCNNSGCCWQPAVLYPRKIPDICAECHRTISNAISGLVV